MGNCLFSLEFALALVSCGLCRYTFADDSSLILPVAGVGDSATEHIASVHANPAQRKLYVGVLSRDAARTADRCTVPKVLFDRYFW